MRADAVFADVSRMYRGLRLIVELGLEYGDFALQYRLGPHAVIGHEAYYNYTTLGCSTQWSEWVCRDLQSSYSE